MADFTGTNDNDQLEGSRNDDNFFMEQKGIDTVSGRGGNDVFYFGRYFNGFNHANPFRHDYVSGGADFDTLNLNGKYVGHRSLVIDRRVIHSIEQITLTGGHLQHTRAYRIRFNKLDTAVTVDGSHLQGLDYLHLDFSHASDAANVNVGQSNGVIHAGPSPLVAALYANAKVQFYGGTAGDTFIWNGTPPDPSPPAAPPAAIGTGALLAQSAFNVHSIYDGGGGDDTLTLNGDMSHGVTFLPTTIHSIDHIVLGHGFNYDITLDDGNVAAGEVLTINGAAVDESDSFFNFDGSAETDGSFVIVGGFRGGVYTTGAGDDTIYGGTGGTNTIAPGAGSDTVAGGSSTDLIDMGAFLDATDTIDGGGGPNDQVNVKGDYAALVTFGAATLSNIDIFSMAHGYDYNFKFDDANVANGATLIVDATDLRPGNSAKIDGSAETNGVFDFRGGAGKDEFHGGSGKAVGGPNSGFGDQISGGAGADRLYVGSGTAEHDLYYLGPASDSSSTHHDFIYQWDGARDEMDIGSSPSITQVTTGSVSKANFDADIAAAVMAHGNNIAFTPDGGDLAGHFYLVIEKGGGAGYQADQDLVIEFINPQHWGTFHFFTIG